MKLSKTQIKEMIRQVALWQLGESAVNEVKALTEKAALRFKQGQVK